MANTITERLTRLEHELNDRRQHVLERRPTPKDWLATVGRLPDDALSRSAERLGREWREQANQTEA